MKSYFPKNIPSDPITFFDSWFQKADKNEHIQYAGAMCLSTVNVKGRPRGRIVLLHHYSKDGFDFMTDRRSDKGRELDEQPFASMTFYWGPLELQVRIEGKISRCSDEISDAYFDERPRRSRITAWASEQSNSIENREILIKELQQWDHKFGKSAPVGRPEYWQAYRLKPDRVEFWEARSRRLHKRICYTRKTTDQDWSYRWLEP